MVGEHPKMEQTAEGALLLNFGEYGREVELAAFSANGLRCLTVQEVGIARVWNVETGECVGEIRPTTPLEGSDNAPTTAGFQVFIEAVALDPTGEFALLGLNDGTAGVFAVADATRLSTLFDPAREPATRWELIRAVAYSPDGTLVLIGFYNRTVGVWRAEDGTEVALLRHPEDSHPYFDDFGPRPSLVTSVAISSDNRFVFAGDGGPAASLWDLATGELVYFAYEHVEKTIAFHREADALRWATSGGTIWEATGDQAPTRALETGESWKEAAFLPDGRQALVRTAVDQVKWWTLEGEETLLKELGKGVWTDAAKLLGFGRKSDLFYPAKERCIVLHSATSEANLQRGAQMIHVVLAPKENWIATEGWSDEIELWSVPSGEKVGASRSYRGISSFAFSADGALMAIAERWHISEGGPYPIHLVRLPDFEPVVTWRGHDHFALAMAFAPDGSWLVSTSLDRTVCLWSLQDASDQPVRRREVPDLKMHDLHVLSNGNILIFREECVEGWNSLFECQVLLSTGDHFYRRVWAVSSDEQFLVFADAMQAVSVWSLTTGERVRTYEAPIERPEAFPPQTFYTQQPTAGAYVWRLPGGPYIHIGDGPRGWATRLTVSGNGADIVIPCESSAAHFALEPTTTLVRQMAFQGRMRAGCVVDGKMLLVNSEGKIFASDPSF